jgi:hypothetical protein
MRFAVEDRVRGRSVSMAALDAARGGGTTPRRRRASRAAQGGGRRRPPEGPGSGRSCRWRGCTHVGEDLLVLRRIDDLSEDRDRRPQHVEGRRGLDAADAGELTRRGPECKNARRD